MSQARAKSVSMFTLGVDDLERSVAFYKALGFSHSPDSDPAMCTFMVSGNIAIGLVSYDFLAQDALLPVSPRQPYCGFTMAINGASAEEVDQLFSLAVAAGAHPQQAPHWKDWGGYDGYSGYFLDPDGFAWEVAFAPFLNLAEDNHLICRAGE